VAVDTVPAVTRNVVELDPWAIVTCEGATAAALEDEIAMVAPPLTAAEVSETVQVELNVGLMATGIQASPFNPGACVMVTVLPVPEMVRELAVAPADELPTKPTAVEVLVVAVDKVITAVATTPFDIAVALRPHTRQVTVPAD